MDYLKIYRSTVLTKLDEMQIEGAMRSLGSLPEDQHRACRIGLHAPISKIVKNDRFLKLTFFSRLVGRSIASTDELTLAEYYAWKQCIQDKVGGEYTYNDNFISWIEEYIDELRTRIYVVKSGVGHAR